MTLRFLMNFKVCYDHLAGIAWKWNYVGVTAVSFPNRKGCPIALLNDVNVQNEVKLKKVTQFPIDFLQFADGASIPGIM